MSLHIRVCLLVFYIWLSDQMFAQQSYEDKGGLPSHIQRTLSPVRSPEKALKSFELTEGFSIELIASEPLIEDPVLIDWDLKGRLWVCEMRGFMMDIAATGQFEKVGRISVLEDTDGDGLMDKASRFLDGLVLPRAMRVFQEGVLVAEHDKLWFVSDADGDLVSEDKVLIDPKYATHGSVEHRPNGLLIGLDNWIYNARSDKRYKRSNGEWIIDSTENRGQWGITMDDNGRLFYNFHWSQLHSDIAPPNTLTRNPNFRPTLSANATVTNDQLVYPIRMNTAVNRGYRAGVLDNEGKLKRFASSCSPWIYRGGAFPTPFHGNAFVCAPAANTIKRNLVTDHGLTVSAINAYPDHDFLASDDERFRPVSLSGGPDGALYVVDMYRGIIQQADFMTEYLRKDSLDRHLEQPINLGRIYRISANNTTSSSLPDFHALSPDGWTNLLAHANGWVRDKAQQWLVWKKPIVAIEALKDLARGPDQRAAVHALWTLAGMNADAFQTCLDLLDHPNAKVAITARTLAARLADDEAEKKTFLSVIPVLFEEDDERSFHTILALGQVADTAQSDLLLKIATTRVENPHIREALVSSLTNRELKFLGSLLRKPDWQKMTTGRKLLMQELAACALRSNQQPVITQLFQLAKGSDWKHQAIREGLLVALHERDRPLQFPKTPGLDDARFLPFLQWPGHDPSQTQAAARPLSAREREQYVAGQAIYSSLCASCHGSEGEGLKMLGPPLVNSEWVTGDADRLAKILLHGLEGPIEVDGKRYAPPDILPAMPPVGMMSNEEIAATMTYIRRAWNHTVDPVRGGDIQRNRDLTTTQDGSYTVEKLLSSTHN